MTDLFFALKRLLEKNVWISIGLFGFSIFLFKSSESSIALRIIRWLLPGLSSDFIETVFVFGGAALICASFYAFYIWIVAYDKKRRNKRKIAMRQAAESMKWSFDENPPPRLRRQINSFIEDRIFSIPAFMRCDRQNVSNVLSAEIDGDTFAVFDFELSGGDGRDSSFAHFETAYMVISDRLNLPYFQTESETWLGDNAVADFVKKKAGVNDLDFPHRPDFSKKYIVGGNQNDVSRVFTLPVFDFYERNQLYRTIGREKMLCLLHWQTEPMNQFQINAQLQTLHNLCQLLKNS